MNNYQESNCVSSLNTVNAERRSCLCSGGALCFFAFLFAFAVGLLLGAIYYETILPVIAAVIAFAAAIAAVIIALIFFWCRRGC